MKALIRIEIDDRGGHWHRRVWVLGMLVYHRHDYTEENRPKTAGFNVMPYAPMDVSEDDGWEDKLKRK